MLVIRCAAPCAPLPSDPTNSLATGPSWDFFTYSASSRDWSPAK
jgi:hypothetical protein